MAYIEKHKDGWRAQVAKLGVRKSKVFVTKTEAKDWANRLEAEIAEGKVNRYTKTFGEAVKKYKEDVSTKKNGERWELMRLDGFLDHFGNVPLTEIQQPQIAEWRDERLKQVTASTVVREANLLRNLFNLAKKEWHWCAHYPFDGVKMPKEGGPRTAKWGWREIRQILRAGRRTGGKTWETVQAFHIALRTAMRLQEALAAPEHLKGKVVHLPKTKTAPEGEKVPLTRHGLKIVQKTPALSVSPNEASVLFSKLCRNQLIEGLTFHDARATALTHMSRKMDVMTLAKISRHQDLRLLQNTYYRETVEEIAERI